MPVGLSVAFRPDNNRQRCQWRPSWTPRSSAAPRRLDYGDVDLRHAHHRVKRALCFIAAGRQRLGQHTRRDLPRHAPLVFAPAARALLAAIADDSVPIAVGLGLIVSGDLEREGFAMFERGTAVEGDTRDAGNFEFDCQHISLLAEWVVTGCTVDGKTCTRPTCTRPAQEPTLPDRRRITPT